MSTKRYPGRMGLCMYARILAFITVEPRTQVEVSQHFDRGAQRVRELLWRMTQLGLAHVVEWRVPPSKRGLLAPVFAGGAGVNVSYPNKLTRAAHGATQAIVDPRPELMAFAVMVKALKGYRCTRARLREVSGVLPHHIRGLLRVLREVGLLHTSGWRRNTDGQPTEFLRFGPGRDAKRPPTKARAAVVRDYVENKRKGRAAAWDFAFGHLRVQGSQEGRA